MRSSAAMGPIGLPPAQPLPALPGRKPPLKPLAHPSPATPRQPTAGPRAGTSPPFKPRRRQTRFLPVLGCMRRTPPPATRQLPRVRLQARRCLRPSTPPTRRGRRASRTAQSCCLASRAAAAPAPALLSALPLATAPSPPPLPPCAMAMLALALLPLQLQAQAHLRWGLRRPWVALRLGAACGVGQGRGMERAAPPRPTPRSPLSVPGRRQVWTFTLVHRPTSTAATRRRGLALPFQARRTLAASTGSGSLRTLRCCMTPTLPGACTPLTAATAAAMPGRGREAGAGTYRAAAPPTLWQAAVTAAPAGATAAAAAAADCAMTSFGRHGCTAMGAPRRPW